MVCRDGDLVYMVLSHLRNRVGLARRHAGLVLQLDGNVLPPTSKHQVALFSMTLALAVVLLGVALSW